MARVLNWGLLEGSNHELEKSLAMNQRILEGLLWMEESWMEGSIINEGILDGSI